MREDPDQPRAPFQGMRLGEFVRLLVVAMVTFVVGATSCIVLSLPFPGRYRYKARMSSCMSNQKQIGLALMAYQMDNDERLPPAHSMVRHTESKELVPTTWAVGHPRWRKIGAAFGLIEPYTKYIQIFQCPEAKGRAPIMLCYLYNDLAATARKSDFAEPSRTVLIADGEEQFDNAGHAWTPNMPPQTALYNHSGTCDAGRGATVANAVSRHTKRLGAYLFADGHAKGLPPGDVFFPPRESAARSHRDGSGRSTGPDPAVSMMHEGHAFKGTFHLR